MNEQDNINSGVVDTIKEIKATVQEIHNRLFVSNGRLSFEVRILLLEEKQKARNKHFWIIYTALTGAFFLVLLEWLALRSPQIIR